jgi:hypothetical protein
MPVAPPPKPSSSLDNVRWSQLPNPVPPIMQAPHPRQPYVPLMTDNDQQHPPSLTHVSHSYGSPSGNQKRRRLRAQQVRLNERQTSR